MPNEQKPRYTLKPTIKPLPSQAKEPEEATDELRLKQNEDDDLYDPYSDYHDGTLRNLEFEENPWS
ncbi:MAG: hypothetical protein Q4F23_03110 [Coriobacteriia bacterium]|nr:hypothetical protein [Coriobacteriia bacterium]